MILWLIFSHIESDGLYYEDENQTRLSGAVPGTTSVVVSSRVITIKGGQKDTDGFAFSILSSLEEVDFTDATSLVSIESNAFASTNLRIINMSNCKSLEIIHSKAFLSCKATEILFPMNGNLTSIESESFTLSNLRGALIPSSVRQIMSSTFRFARSFSSIEFSQGSNLHTIGLIAFESTIIERVRIPKSVINIDSTAFASCSKLVEISVEIGSQIYASEYGILYSKNYKSLFIFPPALQSGEVHYVREGVESIEYEAFRSAQISGIVLPSSVTSLAEWTFWNSQNLIWINMTDSVVNLGNKCFEGTSIEYFLFPSYINVIPTRLFSGCTSLKRVDFNGTITKISDEAFSGCTSLVQFEVMEGVTEVSQSAFKGCSSLIEVWLPQSIEKLGGGLFEGCHPNLSVKFRNEGKFETDDQNIIYSENKTNIIQIFATPLNPDIVVPSTVVNILTGAFASSQITSIILDENLRTIESRAFSNCPKLTSVSIPGEVTLGTQIFSGSKISTIELGRITAIPEEAFSSCSLLTQLTVPSSVVSIGYRAFYNSRIESIIYEEESKLQSIADNCFIYCKYLETLRIPRSVGKLGIKISENSAIQKVIIDDGSNMSEISYSAFMNSIYLSSITFSNTTKVLGEYSLASCIALKNITIKPSITTLADSCLSGCSNLQHIIIQEDSELENIVKSALNGLSSLVSIRIEGRCKGFTSSNEGAVLFNRNKTSIVKYCCQNPLTKFDIPTTVRNIGWCCFEDAVHLKSVSIPSPISEISFRSFAGCTNLSFLSIADSVRAVGENAFEGSKLQCGSVKYPKDIKQKLIDAGIPAEALDKCITSIFSINQDRISRTFPNVSITQTMICNIDDE